MVAPSSLDYFILPWPVSIHLEPKIPRIRNWVPKAFSKSEVKMRHVSSSSSVLGLPQDKKLKDCLSLPRCLQIAESPPQLKPVPLADLGSPDLLPAASPLPPSWVSSSFQLTGCDALSLPVVSCLALCTPLVCLFRCLLLSAAQTGCCMVSRCCIAVSEPSRVLLSMSNVVSTCSVNTCQISVGGWVENCLEDLDRHISKRPGPPFPTQWLGPSSFNICRG